MPSSYTKLVYHVVFGVKERSPAITADIAPELHAYIGGTVKARGGTPLAIGGQSDHVHALFGLHPDHALSGGVRDVKANSSRWVHQRFPDRGAFAWQEGYGAFTVDPRGVAQARKYIAGQEAHHREEAFRAELKRFLDAYGVTYDERYL